MAKRITAREFLSSRQEARDKIAEDYGVDRWTTFSYDMQKQADDFGNYLNSGNYTTADTEKYRSSANKAVEDLTAEMGRYGKSTQQYKTLDSYRQYYQDSLGAFDRIDVGTKMGDYINDYDTWRTQEDYDLQKKSLQDSIAALDAEMEKIEDKNSADYKALQSYRDWYATYEDALNRRAEQDGWFDDVDDYTAYKNSTDFKHVADVRRTIKEKQDELKAIDPSLENATEQDIDKKIKALQSQMNDLQLYGSPEDVQNAQAQLNALAQAKETIGNLDAMRTELGRLEKYGNDNIQQNYGGAYDPNFDYGKKMDELRLALEKAENDPVKYEEISAQIRALAGPNGDGTNENGLYDENTWYGRYLMENFDVEAARKRVAEIDKELKDLGLAEDRWLANLGSGINDAEANWDFDGSSYERVMAKEADPHVMALRQEKTELTQKLNSSERQQGRSKIEASKAQLSPERLAELTEAGKSQLDVSGRFYSGKDRLVDLGVLSDLTKEFGDSDTDKYYAKRAQELLDMVYAAIGAEKRGIDIGYTVDEALKAYEAQINDIAGYRRAAEVNRTDSDFVRWNRQVFGQGGLIGGAISNLEHLPDMFTEEYRPASKTQSMIAHTGEMMGDQYDSIDMPGGRNLAQTIHEAAVTTGNMLPSIGLSAAVTALTGGAGLSAVGASLAGRIAGAIEMGLTSGGQSYQQMLGMGFDAGDARAYGAAMGASEVGTQLALGGITKLGGFSEDALLNLTKKIGNGIIRGLAETAIHDVSEISEELLQNRIEGYLQYSLFDLGTAPKFFEMTEDDWYTVVVTALSTTAMEGPGVAINSYKTNQLGLLASGQKTYSDAKTKGLMSAKLNKQEKARRTLASEIGKAMQGDEALSYTLKAIGSGMEEGTDAYELATKMEAGKIPANSRNLGELFGAILSETTTADGKHLDYDKFMAQTIGGALKFNEIKRAEQAEGDTEKALNDAGQTLAEVKKNNPGAAVLNKTASALSTQYGADPVKAVDTAAVINKIRNGTAISSREMEQITGNSAEAKAARAYLAQQAGGENISVTADAAVTEAMVNELIKTNREQKKLIAEQTKAEVLAAATEAGDAAEVNRAAAGAVTKITAEDVKALQGAKRGVQEAERAAEIAKTRKQTANDMSFEQMAERGQTLEGAILMPADAQMVADLQSQNAELQKTIDELSAVRMPSRAQASQLSSAREQMAENNARIDTIMKGAADRIAKERAEAQAAEAESKKAEEKPKKKGKKGIPPKQKGEETVVMPNGSTMTRTEFNGTDEEWNNMVAQSGGSVMEESNEPTTDNDQRRNALGGQRDGAADQERGDRPEQGSDAGGNRSRGGLLALDGSAVAEVDSDATLTDGSNVSSLEEGYPGIRKFTDGLMESGFRRVTYVTEGGIYNAIGERVPAVYSNRELFLDLDFPSSYYDYQGTADHERLHLKLDLYRQRFGDTEARAFVTAALQDILSRDTYEDAFRKYWKRYAPVYLKNNDKMTVMHMVNEEMLCDMIGGIENFGAELDIFQEDAENFLDASKFDSVTRNLAEDPSVNPGEVVTEAVDVNAMPHNSTEVVLTSDAETTEELLTDSVNPDGEVVATTSDTGQGVFSLRTYDEGGKAALDKFLKKQVKKNSLTQAEADEIRQQMDALYTVCKSYDDGTYGPFSAWSNATVVEIDGRPVFSVIKTNGEYKLNLDFSLVCKKRRALDAVFNEMISRGIMNKIVGDKAFLEMGPASIAQINNIIREHGFETACALCFVDSKRFRQAMIADAFVQMYNAQVLSLVDGVKDKRPTFFNYGGDQKLAVWQEGKTGIETLADFELNWSRINQILNDPEQAPHGRSSGTVEWKIANHLKNNPSARKLASRGDFMSTAGFDALNANNPELLSLYNSKKGAGGPKAAQSDVQYLNDVINSVGFNAKAAYEVGGVRIQSFSDYVGRLVFDYIQMMGDLAAKKLPAHAYTKEFLFAQQFGLTGVKINMSLVPRVLDDGVAPGLDKDGNYAWMDGQSFGSTVYDNNGKRMTAAEGFELAIQIQNADGYSKNCGTIAVGVSREHILKMLDDPNIRMIIPYHKSGINHLVAAMNQIDRYTDYTDTQNTRKKKYSENGTLYDPATGKRFDWVKLDKGEKDFNWNDTLQRLEREGKGAREAAEEYKRWCAERGYDPKFSEFAYHPNYYKVLEDFTAYDRDGTTPAPLGAVQMNFPTEANAFGSMQDLIKSGLEEDAMLQAKQEAGVTAIVDEVEATMPMWEEQLREQGEEFAIESGRQSLERTQMRDSTVRNSIQAAEIELTRDPIEEAEEGATTTRYSLRQEPAPKKTQWGFKLMTVDENGLPHAMFIDAAAPYEYGVWYNADSPKLENLLHLEPGYAYLVDADDNADMATRKPIRKVNGSFRGLPSKAEVNQATTDGKRWMVIDKYADGSVNVQNVGINGSGGISTFALRPGIHAVDIPSMAHIGAKSEGSKKIDTRRPNQRWFLIEYPVDNDYNQEAYGHRTKDIREHLPENGWYSFQTNSGAEARQHWFITGGMKIVGAVSEADIRKFAKDRGFEEDLPWKQGKAYSEDDAIDLDKYIRTTGAMPTPSKSEMRQRIEAERKQSKPTIPAKNQTGDVPRFALGPGEEAVVYVKDGVRKDGSTVDFVDAILNDEKLIETRDHNRLKQGWVGLSKGGKNGVVVGRMLLGKPIEVSNDPNHPKYDKGLYDAAMIEGTDYDIEPGKTKWFYPILKTEDFRDNPKPILRNGNYGVYQRETVANRNGEGYNSPTLSAGIGVDKNAITGDSRGNDAVRESRRQTEARVSLNDGQRVSSGLREQNRGGAGEDWNSLSVDTRQKLTKTVTDFFNRGGYSEVDAIRSSYSSDEEFAKYFYDKVFLPAKGNAALFEQNAKYFTNNTTDLFQSINKALGKAESASLFSIQGDSSVNSLYPEGTLQRDILDVLQTSGSEGLTAWVNEQKAKHEDALENAKIKAPSIPTKGFVSPVSAKERALQRSTLEALINRYGTMKPSEKSNGFVLPPKNQKGQPLRRHIQNVLSSENISDEARDHGLRFTLTNFNATYVQDSNKDLLENAVSEIKDMGPEHALATFKHNASKVNLGTKGILQTIALGEQLLLETSSNGDMANFIDVLSSVCELGTTIGKSLQAFRLLKQSGPIGQLYYVQKAVDRLNKQNEERLKRGKFKEIVVKDDLAKAVINAQEGEERDKAMDALIADIASQAPVTLRDRWNAWRYLAMLGNARTHVRNIVGNAFFAPMRYVKDVMAAGGEFLATKAGLMEEEDRTKALTVSRELRDFALSDADVMQKELQGNGKYNPAQEILQARKLLPGFLNTLSKANGNALEKEDWWFLRGAYARALSQQLSHLGYSVEEMQTTVEGQEALNRARKNAILEAQKATYRDFVAAASWLNRGKHLTGPAGTILSIGLEGVLPFTKTPINILRRGVEYSPLGIAKGIGTILSGVKNGNLDVAEAIDQLAAGLTGTGVAVLGLLLARMGVLRGKKGDDDEENFDKMQGMQDYSLQLGDQSFTIDWAAPTALPLFTGAAVAQLLEESGEDGLQAKDIWNGIMMIAEPMTSLSMLDGLNKLIESTAYASGNEKIATIATQAATSYLGQAFPTILGQVARSIDGTRRSTYVDKNSPIPAAAQRFVQSSVQAKIPGWENAKVPYIDAWGRQSEPSSKVLNGIENFFAPWYRNVKQVTDVDEELKDLYSKTKADILPSVPQKYFSVGGEKKYLTADEWVSYATDVGQTKYDLMTQLISDPRYLALDDTKKARVIKDYIYKYAGAVGKFHADPNYDIHGTGVWIEEAEAAATDYERFERIWQQIEKTLKD